jgi:hypothetical protein
MNGSVTGSRNVGGLVGSRFQPWDSVIKCAFNGEVTGEENVGALIGYSEYDIDYNSLITEAKNKISPKGRINGHNVGKHSIVGDKR